MFVTLFNLQGAHRSQRREFILPSRFALVKHFFQVFQNFFQRFSKRKPSGSLPGRPRGRPVYITTASSLCQALFQIFFDLFSCSTRSGREFSTALADSLRRIPHTIPLVKHFFPFFRVFSFRVIFPLFRTLPHFSPLPASPPNAELSRTCGILYIIIYICSRPEFPVLRSLSLASSIDFIPCIRYHKRTSDSFDN